MKHIEDLTKDQMLHIASNLSKMRVTEKIDGSNLVFGFDDDGQLYTSRLNKGRVERYYDPSDYENIPVNNTFKAAHAVLALHFQANPIDKPNYGTVYESEVLFGRQPNAVVYGSNRIVFISKFPHPLPEDQYTVTTDMIFSDDGRSTYTESVTSTWAIDNVPVVQVPNIYLDDSLSKEQAKDILVENILRHVQPTFRDATDIKPHEDFGVEGVVIEDPNTGDVVKLVDKHTFTLINQFNFAIRNELKAAGPRFNPANNTHLYTTFAATVGYQKTSIYDTMLSEIADMVGIPGLGKYMSITRTLKKYADPQQFLADWKLYDLDAAKAVFDHAVGEAIYRLTASRGAFLRQWQTYELILTSGKSVRYTEEIYKRTLVVFAEILREFNHIRNLIAQSTSWIELSRAIYGKQMQLAFPD
jgi:hypothetical protein